MPNNWKWSSKVLEQVLAWRCKLELVEDINSNKAKSNLVMMCECAVSINSGRSSNETGNQGWLHWPKNKQWFLLREHFITVCPLFFCEMIQGGFKSNSAVVYLLQMFVQNSPNFFQIWLCHLFQPTPKTKPWPTTKWR